MNNLKKAYELGWIQASKWAKREDLIADIGSPAYVREAEAALAGQQPQEEHLTITWDEQQTRILAVTMQDEEGRILKVLAEAPAQQPHERHLLNLLARIHGDGGHYTAEHGLEKSVSDADQKVADLHLKAWEAQQPQYEAADMASAHNDGFRAGVASVAQQPQARPDFTDEWTGYLKDGETPFERFLRERKDLDALTKLYQRALEENERLKAQQPQAKAVQDDLITVRKRPQTRAH